MLTRLKRPFGSLAPVDAVTPRCGGSGRVCGRSACRSRYSARSVVSPKGRPALWSPCRGSMSRARKYPGSLSNIFCSPTYEKVIRSPAHAVEAHADHEGGRRRSSGCSARHWVTKSSKLALISSQTVVCAKRNSSSAISIASSNDRFSISLHCE